MKIEIRYRGIDVEFNSEYCFKENFKIDQKLIMTSSLIWPRKSIPGPLCANRDLLGEKLTTGHTQ